MVNFKGKKVLVMGLGLNGGALAVVKWLLKQQAIVTVTDFKTKAQLKSTLDILAKSKGQIKYTLGRHDLADFVNQDLIIQNPGVPRDSIFLQQARQNNIPIINEAVMFFGLYPGRSIAVTGTRGKSTTSTLIHQILKTSIKNNVVTGNIAINPMLDVLSKIKINSWPVLELSSWHLEIMGDYKISPHIAVVTNVLNDHLNRYKNFAEYKKAKEVILKYQTKKDKAILNADNLDSLSFTKSTLADTYFYSLKKSSLFSSGSKNKGVYLENNKIYFKDKKQSSLVMDTAKIKILGQHNLSNILAAVCVAKIVGISNQNISRAINNFKGVKYRLEHKANLAGLDIYNDSASTTPDAALAAIEAMGGRKIILIAGGQDKKLDYDKLARKIKSKVAYTVLLAGSGSDKLKKELHKIKYSPANMTTDITSLKKAWAIAWQQKNQGELILFSPAATSFNMFKNEFDRARQFDALIYDKQKKKK